MAEVGIWEVQSAIAALPGKTIKPWKDGDARVHCSHCALCGRLFPTVSITAHNAECYQAAIRALEQRWIPCSERMPDSDVEVLVVSVNGIDKQVATLEFTDDSEGNGEPYWSADTCDLTFADYPHWLPIPDPPAIPVETERKGEV